MSRTRFVILPGDNRHNFEMRTSSLDAFREGGEATLGGMAMAIAMANTLATHGKRGAGRTAPPNPFGQVLGRIGERDALLVSLDDKDRLTLQRTYPGLRIAEEGKAEMAMLQCPLQPISAGAMAGTMAGATVASRDFLVSVTDPSEKPLAGVPVYVLTDLSTTPPTGAESKTDSKGVARFPLPAKAKVARVLALPRTRHWSSVWSNSAKSRPKALKLVCRPIDPLGLDGLRRLHPAGGAADGSGVTVAVIDGGATHDALRVASGDNLTDGARTGNWGDNGVGHGTHVAGIIAAQPGEGHPTGLAPGVRLLIYRVYTKDSQQTGSFAVAAAIRKAVDQGADLINLSLTLGGDVSVTEREIKRARAKGALCIAAAGNSADAVKFPARFTNVVGVSAIAVRDGWPRESHPFDVRSSPKAKGHPELGVAAFSCHGPEIDFAAPGIGVVSLVPRNSFGSMMGTSMAAPAITGLVARKLAASPRILDAARDQARSDQIFVMATDAARTVGLPSRYEGHGVLTR